MANGTIRLSVIFQSIVALRGMHKSTNLKVIDTKFSLIPAVLGAFLGAYLAVIVDNSFMRNFIGVLMICMLGIILLNPKKWLKKVNSPKRYDKTWWGMALMFLVGVYGGFIQAGVGVFLLASLVLAIGYNMKNANIIKLLIVFFYALPVMLIFAFQGQIEWKMAILFAVGQSIGAYLGAKFATSFPKAALYTYRLLIVIVSIAIIQFYELWYWVKFW